MRSRMSTIPNPIHPAIAAYAIRNGTMLVGDMPIERLAVQVGTTPFFAYDRKHISDRIAELREYLPKSICLSYAIKANPMAAVVQHIAALVDGFDVASGQEMTIALDTPMSSRNVSFAGPGKSTGDLRRAIAAGIQINAESVGELTRIAEEAMSIGAMPRIALRVNPAFELKASGMKMGGGPKPFGIDEEDIPDALNQLSRLNLSCTGFQIFCGSQILSATALAEAQEKTVSLALSLARRSGHEITYINIGGGFGIPYFPKDEPLNLKAVGENLRRLTSLAACDLPKAHMVIELGRYIVGEAGVYVCQVIDKKVSRDTVYLVTNGGLHHHLAASGNLGQVIRRNFPVAVGNRMEDTETETVTVVGCLCTPLDIIAEKVTLPKAQVGDFIVVFQSGAYAATASPTSFLSHPTAPEILV